MYIVPPTKIFYRYIIKYLYRSFLCLMIPIPFPLRCDSPPEEFELYSQFYMFVSKPLGNPPLSITSYSRIRRKISSLMVAQCSMYQSRYRGQVASSYLIHIFLPYCVASWIFHSGMLFLFSPQRDGSCYFQMDVLPLMKNHTLIVKNFL